MNEYYMKMKDLMSKLKAEGYSITGRMIKHYIDIGILQKPYYKCSNQALYADFHYVRIKRILTEKASGKSIAKIKEEIFAKQKEIISKAKEMGLETNDITAINSKFGVMEKEEAILVKEGLVSDKSYTKEELLSILDGDNSVIDLAVDTGIISDKDEYDSYDLYILISVRNLIKVKKQNSKQSGQLIERISEISKIGNIALELAGLFSKDKTNAWLYYYLLEAVVLSEIKKQNETSPEKAVLFDDDVLNFPDMEKYTMLKDE